MLDGVPIGEAAKHSGVKAPTSRYYEQIGLLPAPPRTQGNRRSYAMPISAVWRSSATRGNWGSRSRRSELCLLYRTIRASLARRPTASPKPALSKSSSASEALQLSRASWN